jgi:hypothetical protein
MVTTCSNRERGIAAADGSIGMTAAWRDSANRSRATAVFENSASTAEIRLVLIVLGSMTARMPVAPIRCSVNRSNAQYGPGEPIERARLATAIMASVTDAARLDDRSCLGRGAWACRSRLTA